MSAFLNPHPGETPDEFRSRREEYIRYVIDKLQWPRMRAIELLESLDSVGLAMVAFDMRTDKAKQVAAEKAYDPFAGAFEVR